LELKGAYKKDPQRRRPPSPKSKLEIGNPPDHLDPEEAAIWFEIIGISAPGVLVSSDRLILARLCQLEKRVRDDSATISETAQHLRVLTLLGLTPADRSRIATPGKEDSNPFASF
jgi:hypothetical protein